MSVRKSRIRDLLSLHEGRIPYAYQDSLGYWTIGVGHLIDKRKGGRLPEKIIDDLLDWDIRIHASELYKALPWLHQLDEVRQCVMIDMCFNLGIEPFDGDGFKDWPIFISQVKNGEYAKAAANMRSTLWAQQVKARAVRLANMMETGEWPTDVEWTHEEFV